MLCVIQDSVADTADMPVSVRALLIALILMGTSLGISAGLACAIMAYIDRVSCSFLPLGKIMFLVLCLRIAHGADFPVPGLRALKLFAVRMVFSHGETAHGALAGMLSVISGGPLLNLMLGVVQDCAANTAHMPVTICAMLVAFILVGPGLDITAGLASTEVAGIGRVLRVLFPLGEIVVLMLCLCIAYCACLPVLAFGGLKLTILMAGGLFVTANRADAGVAFVGLRPVTKRMFRDTLLLAARALKPVLRLRA